MATLAFLLYFTPDKHTTKGKDSDEELAFGGCFADAFPSLLLLIGNRWVFYCFMFLLFCQAGFADKCHFPFSPFKGQS